MTKHLVLVPALAAAPAACGAGHMRVDGLVLIAANVWMPHHERSLARRVAKRAVMESLRLSTAGRAASGGDAGPPSGSAGAMVAACMAGAGAATIGTNTNRQIQR